MKFDYSSNRIFILNNYFDDNKNDTDTKMYNKTLKFHQLNMIEYGIRLGGLMTKIPFQQNPLVISIMVQNYILMIDSELNIW